MAKTITIRTLRIKIRVIMQTNSAIAAILDKATGQVMAKDTDQAADRASQATTENGLRVRKTAKDPVEVDMAVQAGTIGIEVIREGRGTVRASRPATHATNLAKLTTKTDRSKHRSQQTPSASRVSSSKTTRIHRVRKHLPLTQVATESVGISVRSPSS